ncbi:MAG: hypothetical protein KGH71_04900 [Candidatus Micrarchaeota archaeon]|nr:hypothetical protein [Candidatus Micrarchaeota archaeon]
MDVPVKAEIKQAIDKAEISIILDAYEDIFSDFDPRPFSERALSEDFLVEARKRTRDKKIGIELHFLIPGRIRDATSEALITNRLRDHFKRQHRKINEEFSRKNRFAIALMAFGLIVGLAAALLISFANLGMVGDNTVGIVFTIVSWYSIWTGLDRLLFKSHDETADREFFRKMASAKIIFTPY